ncbi:MAG: hypothetical protein HRT45_13675 [Bdellovibrionales bacterium]|nr:hypothetical protein [Bdellovibrionales bacterium]
MKNLLKLAALSMAFSGLVACSTAKKQDDNVVADIDTEQSIEETNQEGFQPIEDTTEDDTSLGMGSSGLGH